MKRYGFNFATEFTARQINVIYGCAKRGELKVEKFVMQNFYSLADYYGTDSNRSVADREASILRVLDAVFAHDYNLAQSLIDNYTDLLFKCFSAKMQNAADKSLVG